jgi:hypothetical protein
MQTGYALQTVSSDGKLLHNRHMLARGASRSCGVPHRLAAGVETGQLLCTIVISLNG